MSSLFLLAILFQLFNQSSDKVLAKVPPAEVPCPIDLFRFHDQLQMNQFECTSNQSCPPQFICCNSRGFVHKICQPSTDNAEFGKYHQEMTRNLFRLPTTRIQALPPICLPPSEDLCIITDESTTCSTEEDSTSTTSSTIIVPAPETDIDILPEPKGKQIPVDIMVPSNIVGLVDDDGTQKVVLQAFAKPVRHPDLKVVYCFQSKSFCIYINDAEVAAGGKNIGTISSTTDQASQSSTITSTITSTDDEVSSTEPTSTTKKSTTQIDKSSTTVSTDEISSTTSTIQTDSSTTETSSTELVSVPITDTESTSSVRIDKVSSTISSTDKVPSSQLTDSTISTLVPTITTESTSTVRVDKVSSTISSTKVPLTRSTSSTLSTSDDEDVFSGSGFGSGSGSGSGSGPLIDSDDNNVQGDDEMALDELFVDSSIDLTAKQCAPSAFFCLMPFDVALTSRISCQNDGECARGLQCCHHKCFGHKVCATGQ